VTTRRRPKRRSSFRASVFLFWVLLGVMTFAVALNLLVSAPQALGRLDVSWGVNDSQEGAYALQAHRVAAGGELFEAPRALDSPEGGPVYPLVLAAFASRGSSSAVVPYRHVSAALWLLSLLPLCAITLLFAREAGLRRNPFAPLGIGLATTILLALAVFERSPSVTYIGPQSLLAPLVLTAVALYYALVFGVVRERYIWALVLASVLAVLVDERAVLIFPLLLAGLAFARKASPRALLFAGLEFLVALVLLAVIMPVDWRAWGIALPLAHVWTVARPFRAWQFLEAARGRPLIAAELLGLGIALVIFARRNGGKTNAVHAFPLVAVALLVVVSYFGALGASADFALFALLLTPYCATVAALVTVPRFVGRADRSILRASAALLVALAVVQFIGAMPSAATPAYEEMTVAPDAVRAFCAHRRVLVTTLPDLAFGCPDARYALAASYVELVAARRGFYDGLTIFDRPTSYVYIIDSTGIPMPVSWQRELHLEQAITVPADVDGAYVTTVLRLWGPRTKGEKVDAAR
jgi:hypothetical protein